MSTDKPEPIHLPLPVLSFIIPAHNESHEICQTIRAIHESASKVGKLYEIIVVDDASTDGTGRIAEENGARVVPVEHRQIAATRNSGGHAARGDRLFFVDADTKVTPDAVQAAVRWMDQGAVGGGASTKLSGDVPLYAHLLFLVFYLGGKVVGTTGGAFLFCTRIAFNQVGGFNEKMFAGEEVHFCSELKRHGRFVVLWRRLLTSGRRFRTVPGLTLIFLFLKMLFLPSRTVRERRHVQPIWYDSNRSSDERASRSWTFHLSNAAALFIVIVVFTGPLWRQFPWPDHLLEDWAGTLRVLIGLILISAGLMLWPCAWLLLKTLPRQTRVMEILRNGALMLFCIVKASGSTQALYQFLLKLWKLLPF